MIEPTDEMEQAMVYGGPVRERLAAVLAIVERDRPDPSEALRAAYWKLRGHASAYRSTDIFRRRQEFFRADPDNAVAARGAARDEWYARGLEAAANDFAELLELEYDASIGAAPSDTEASPLVGEDRG